MVMIITIIEDDYDIIGGGKGGAMGLQPHLILYVLHRISIFTVEIFSIQ